MARERAAIGRPASSLKRGRKTYAGLELRSWSD
jgi:hypothetical protein